MRSLFSKIIVGDIPSYKVAEDDLFYAFLDINPLAKGHTLIVPKRETDYFFELNHAELSAMLPFAKRIADKLKKVTECNRVGIAVIGFEVPHAHMHLVPMQTMADIDFTQPKLKFSKEEFTAMATALELA
jgi:histidine triad (HIT) family protein